MTTRDNTSSRLPSAWQQLKSRSLSVETIRQVDRTAIDRYHMNSLVLVENAAIGCARWLTDRLEASATGVIFCGRGNNGGDGLAIARHLRLAGHKVHVVQVGPLDKLSPDARANWNILHANSLTDCVLIENDLTGDIKETIGSLIDSAQFLIDALLGSGAQGNPRAPLSDLIRLANASSALRVAIDIPSGLDAATGQAGNPTFQAHATLTFVARKVGFDLPSAQSCLGQVEVLPIGIPVELIEELLAKPLANQPLANAGHVS